MLWREEPEAIDRSSLQFSVIARRIAAAVPLSNGVSPGRPNNLSRSLFLTHVPTHSAPRAVMHAVPIHAPPPRMALFAGRTGPRWSREKTPVNVQSAGRAQ